MRVFAAICLLGVLATFADAQIVRRCVTPTYQTPVYHQQTYYTPYVAPTYYAPTYVQPYALPVAITQDYYFSVDSSYRDKNLLDALTGRIALMGKLGMLPGQEGQQQPMQPAPKQFAQQPAFDPKLATAVPEGLKALVDSKCVKCHSGGKGRADLTDLTSVPRGIRWEAFGNCSDNSMPKGGPPLSDTEVVLVHQWAKLASK